MLFSKGETRLNGKHENIINYLDKLPRNVKKLDYNLEKKIAKAIWALTKRFSDMDEDHDIPHMSAAFCDAMVTPKRHSAQRVGLQLWFSSGAGISARVGYCREESRCFITNNNKQQQQGSIPKCKTCNSAKFPPKFSF
mmetsp:Transcript_19979/g.39673  ORF Transcript_19979/g.39673 Transcript_19979/m.39673 type:complete len:138 (-) Transcript_19979:214-627(-)